MMLDQGRASGLPLQETPSDLRVRRVILAAGVDSKMGGREKRGGQLRSHGNRPGKKQKWARLEQHSEGWRDMAAVGIPARLDVSMEKERTRVIPKYQPELYSKKNATEKTETSFPE